MFVIHISDLETFLHMARRLEVPVQVTRSVTVVPHKNDHKTVMLPAVSLDYALEFEDIKTGETTWTMREVITGDEDGLVSLIGTLLDKLQGLEDVTVQMVRRTGAF